MERNFSPNRLALETGSGKGGLTNVDRAGDESKQQIIIALDTQEKICLLFRRKSRVGGSGWKRST